MADHLKFQEDNLLLPVLTIYFCYKSHFLLFTMNCFVLFGALSTSDKEEIF